MTHEEHKFLHCQMAGCESFASTAKLFCLHMRVKHGGRIEESDILLVLSGKRRRVRPRGTTGTNFEQCVRLIRQGKSTKEIAAELKITRQRISYIKHRHEADGTLL